MKMAMRILRNIWDFIAAVVIAAAAARWLTAAAVKEVTTEIIAFFAIQSAVILPAMIFTAGLLRGDGLSVGELERFQDALRRQMYFWITLLALDFLSTGLLIVGKAAEWRWKVTVLSHSFELGWILIGVTALLGSWAVLRMVPFVKGVLSLLELNGWLAKKAIEARQGGGGAAADLSATSPTPFEKPQGYGRIGKRKSAR
jgi:hypothetical protein